MAFGADFYVDVFFGGADLPDLTACAGDGGRTIIRMNTLLHVCHLFLTELIS